MGEMPIWRIRNKRLNEAIYMPSEIKYGAYCMATFRFRQLGWSRDDGYAIHRVPDLRNVLDANNDYKSHYTRAMKSGLIINDGNCSYAFCTKAAAKRYAEGKRKSAQSLPIARGG